MNSSLKNLTPCLLKFFKYTIGQKFCSMTTRAEVQASRIAAFDHALETQKSLVPRIEKINVSYPGKPAPHKLIMNKSISTPYNCAQHIHESLIKRSALAFVEHDGKGEFWDLHRPLEWDCTLHLLDFYASDEYLDEINKAFWRSCSFLLGKIVSQAFQNEFDLHPYCIAPPDCLSGSFVFDAFSSDKSWTPTKGDLQSLTKIFQREALQGHHFNRITLKSSDAENFFEIESLKGKLLSLKEELLVYRVGDYCDACSGPLISHTGLIGRVAVAAVHPIETDQGFMYRFQGLAIPSQLEISMYAFQLLLERAKKLNTTGLSPSRSGVYHLTYPEA